MLNATGICKAFHGNTVLDDVDFDLRPGEVHALIGENGAGKSTLVNILSGNHAPDAGRIQIEGVAHRFNDPLEAMHAGVAVVHQELSLVPNATVAENIFLRREITNRFGLNDWRKMMSSTRALFEIMDVDIDPAALVGSLSTGMQQLVEVAKAISFDARYLFMDEPTSSLSEKEIDELFKVVDDLREKGLGIVFISHKLSELFIVSDRITVLRDGRFIGTRMTAKTGTSEIIGMMVGRELDTLYPARTGTPGEVIFRCKSLSAYGVVADISFDVRRGEILGIAGLVGSGRTETMRSLINADKRTSGTFEMEDREIEIENPADAMRQGIVYVSEDRKRSGLFLGYSIEENISVSMLRKTAGPLGMVDTQAISNSAAAFIEHMDIRPARSKARVIDLSGGNQQKVLISKALATNPRLLIVDEPTRGVDVGAKALIHRRLRDMAEAGTGIVLVSSDLPEMMGMADRIVVFRSGRVSAILDNHEGTLGQKEIMTAAID